MRGPSIAVLTLALGVAIVSSPAGADSAMSESAAELARQGGAGTSPSGTIATYCVPCHNDRRKSGGISLASFDVANATNATDVAERVIRRVRAGMMPPAGARQPEREVLTALAAAIEHSVDTASAAAPPDPGHRPFQRLNRAEYGQAIRDLVGVEIDPGGLLPPDTISSGFDNVADVQTFLPTLVTSYLQAARQISGQAVANDLNRLVYACWPKSSADESNCANRIVAGLATRAYRGAATTDDLRDAMTFYQRAARRPTFAAASVWHFNRSWSARVSCSASNRSARRAMERLS
jgi:hypothetical protein